MYTIEIDHNVWTYLQKHAEPFVDTPNCVLNRLLFESDESVKKWEPASKAPSVTVQGTPKGLSQILEVLYEMALNGYSRTEATNRVAKNLGTTPQTVMDKYCRQLNKTANEIDDLLSEPGFEQFKDLLKSKFTNYRAVIDTYFETLLYGAKE
jgi:negative regulator of replication initiation